MAEFASAFPGVVPDRNLTARELTRGLRMMLAAEEEAVHLYEALADATDNELARAVLQDIADEERVHVGEFQRLLSILLPDEDGFLAEGAQEVDEMAAGQGD
jgi:rubrerythrin